MTYVVQTKNRLESCLSLRFSLMELANLAAYFFLFQAAFRMLFSSVYFTTEFGCKCCVFEQSFSQNLLFSNLMEVESSPFGYYLEHGVFSTPWASFSKRTLHDESATRSKPKDCFQILISAAEEAFPRTMPFTLWLSESNWPGKRASRWCPC